MFRRVLVYHRDDLMRSRGRADRISMHQVGMGSGKPNGCQNQAKSYDEETAYTHIVMLAYLPNRCHSCCELRLNAKRAGGFDPVLRPTP